MAELLSSRYSAAGAAVAKNRDQQLRENGDIHTRLLKFALGVEESADYWSHVSVEQTPVGNEEAFEEGWFGHASERRVRVVLSNMRVRFDAYPQALSVLSRWGPKAKPTTQALICHWHLQLADPIYRRFTGDFLDTQRASADSMVRRHDVIEWVDDQQPDRWANPTLTQWTSKLLSASESAGLVDGKRGDRKLDSPSVPNTALSYLVHLLRDVEIDGSILDNPYLRSVGLTGRLLEDRIRRLSGIEIDQMGDLIDVRSKVDSLAKWPEVFG